MGLLKSVLGSVKDKASFTKAALTSTSADTRSLRLAVVTATSHDASLPSAHSLISLSTSIPRATAASAVDALISRLRRSRSSAVALKCLLLLHSLIHGGSFILHDQLPLFLSGRRNHLNLCDFRDASSAAAWRRSNCVRWYARYLEQILSVSRVLGSFLFSPACLRERRIAAENISSLLNTDLLREIDALIGVLEEIARFPSDLDPIGGELESEVVRLVAEDHRVAVIDLASRINEFTQRLDCLNFGDSVELVCALKRVDTLLRGKKVEAPAVALRQLVRRLKAELAKLTEKVEVTALVRTRRTGASTRSEEKPRTGVNLARFSSNRYG